MKLGQNRVIISGATYDYLNSPPGQNVLLALLIKVLKVLKILLLKQQSKRIFDLMTDSIEPVKNVFNTLQDFR
jgi:hypothetical protein